MCRRRRGVEKSQFLVFGPHGFGFDFGIFIWCGFVSYCVFILVWGLTVVDFSYILLWSVSVFSRLRVDIPLCYQNGALLRGTGFIFHIIISYADPFRDASEEAASHLTDEEGCIRNAKRSNRSITSTTISRSSRMDRLIGRLEPYQRSYIQYLF